MSTFLDFFLDFLLSSFYQNKPFLNYPTKYSKTKIEIFCQLCQPSNNFSSDSRRLECERLLGTKDLLISPLMVSIKTFTENQYSKRHLMDLSWHMQRLPPKKRLHRNKTFLFFKIEAETFSICLKQNFMRPHKILNHLAYSDNCYFHFFLWVV